MEKQEITRSREFEKCIKKYVLKNVSKILKKNLKELEKILELFENQGKSKKCFQNSEKKHFPHCSGLFYRTIKLFKLFF